jgi:hypothetical protein
MQLPNPLIRTRRCFCRFSGENRGGPAATHAFPHFSKIEGANNSGKKRTDLCSSYFLI